MIVSNRGHKVKDLINAMDICEIAARDEDYEVYQLKCQRGLVYSTALLFSNVLRSTGV